MGFLSRTVADARARAPVVSATAPAVERAQAADGAEGWEVVEMAFSPESEQTPSSPSPAAPPLSPPSPSGVERAATLLAAPAMASARPSPPHAAPGGDGSNDAPNPAARAPGGQPDLPVARSTNSPAPLATAGTAMTAPGALSTLEQRASPRTPVGAEPPRSHEDEAASRQARAGVPDARPARSPEHTHARVDQRPAARAPIVQIETAAPPGARTEPAAPQATRAAAPALQEPIPPDTPRPTPAVRNETLVPAPGVEVSPSARAIEPRSPMPEPVAAPRVHIGRLEVIVVAPSQPPARPAQRGWADLASRRYLRNA
jgi:hypothetical protein